MGGIAANAGAGIGEGIGASISATKIMSDNLLKTVVKYIVLFFVFVVSLAILGAIIQEFVIIIFLFVFVSFIVSTILGKLNFRKYKKLRKKLGSPEEIDEAISQLSARHPETQLLAMRAIHDVCQKSPGRLLKNTSRDRESLVSVLVGQLSETNEDLLEACSGSIKWLARDHGEMFLSHSKTIARHIDSPHATVQVNIAIALGNIAQFDQEHHSSYAQALVPAAKDLDSEVRKAAAVALGNIRCSESVKILEHLADNETAPDVSQEARNSLQKIRSHTT